MGSIIRASKGDNRSLDYSLFGGSARSSPEAASHKEPPRV